MFDLLIYNRNDDIIKKTKIDKFSSLMFAIIFSELLLRSGLILFVLYYFIKSKSLLDWKVTTTTTTTTMTFTFHKPNC